MPRRHLTTWFFIKGWRIDDRRSPGRRVDSANLGTREEMSDVFQLFQQPTFLLNGMVGVGILLLWLRGVESRRRLMAVTVPYVLLNIACTRVAGVLLQTALIAPYPPIDTLPEDSQAIVVLAGYAYAVSELHNGPSLGSDTLHRCDLAADLYTRGRKTRIVTTGGPSGGDAAQPACAALMRDYLIERGIDRDHITVEPNSQNTYENAVETCRLLKADNIRHVVLVTDAEHMRRAVACFRKQGIEVAAAPTQFHLLGLKHTLGDVLPNPREASDFEMSFREWLGIFYYRLRGRL